MANTQATYGFKHIGYVSGNAPDYQMQARVIASTNSTKIYRGDPVVKASGGFIAQASGTTTTLDGVFDGCFYQDATGYHWSPYWPGSATADATAYVISAPGALFQVAAFLTAIVTSNIDNNATFQIGTGSTATGFSGATLDQASIATTNTFPFRIVSLSQQPGNGSDPTTNYNWVVVTFNNENFKQLTGVA